MAVGGQVTIRCEQHQQMLTENDTATGGESVRKLHNTHRYTTILSHPHRHARVRFALTPPNPERE